MLLLWLILCSIAAFWLLLLLLGGLRPCMYSITIHSYIQHQTNLNLKFWSLILITEFEKTWKLELICHAKIIQICQTLHQKHHCFISSDSVALRLYLMEMSATFTYMTIGVCVCVCERVAMSTCTLTHARIRKRLHFYVSFVCTLPWLTSLSFLHAKIFKLHFFSSYCRAFVRSPCLYVWVCVWDRIYMYLFLTRVPLQIFFFFIPLCSDLWLSLPFKWFRFYDDNNNHGK